jgi:hypothetical protein
LWDPTIMNDDADRNATSVDDSMIRGQQVVLVTSCEFGPHFRTFQWQSNYTRMTVCGQEKETKWPNSVWYKIENLIMLRPSGLTIWLDGVPAKLALWFIPERDSLPPRGDKCLSTGGEFAYPEREFTWPSSNSSDVDIGLDEPRPVYLQISPLDAHGLPGVFSITIKSRDPSCILETRHHDATVPSPQLLPTSRGSSPAAVASSTIAPTTTSPGITTTNVSGYERPTASPISTTTTNMTMGNNETVTTPPLNQSNVTNNGNPLSRKDGSIILVSFTFFLVATLVASGALWTQRRRHHRRSQRQQQQQQQQKTHERDNDNDPTSYPLERSPPQSFIVVNGLNDEGDHYNDEGGETENTLDDADDEYYNNNDDDDDDETGSGGNDDDLVVPTPWILFRSNNNNASGTTFMAGRNRRNRRRPDILPTVDESSMEESSQYSRSSSRYGSMISAPTDTTTTTNSTSALDDTTTTGTAATAATADANVTTEHRLEDDVERIIL